MRDRFSDYADNYTEYKNFIYSFLKDRPITDGYDAQCDGLYFIDEDTLIERERLIMMLSVIKWEIDHDMLTEELKDELDYYYDELISERLLLHIEAEDLQAIKTDLTDCYKNVFGQ